jgi:hypothetical protein
MINIKFHTSFKWEIRYGFICKKAPHRTPQEAKPLLYGPYTITKVVGENDFELSIPPFLGLHLVFNVELL